MDNGLRTKWIFLALALVLSGGCEDKSDNLPSGAKKRVVDASNSEAAQDLTKLPHEAANDLLLTAEVLDQEKWIVALTWENVGDTPLTLPMAGLLKENIRKGYANPLYRPAYSKEGISLSNGKHSDRNVLDLTRDGNYREEDAYDLLREVWGLGGSFHESLLYNQIDQSMRLRSGEKITCFFRYPSFKTDDESGNWKEGDRIPVDFRYFVGEEVGGGNRVSLSSGENGQVSKHQPPSVWRGEAFSNVVYLPWSSTGERVRWPASPDDTFPPEPVNDLLLSLDIVDEEKWIVRLTWKNVGKTPVEVPVTEALWDDMKESNGYKAPPVLCTLDYYTNYRYYGRPFGSSLGWGEEVDRKLFDLDRGLFDLYKHGKYERGVDEVYVALLRLEGKFVSTHRISGVLSGTKWQHLEPGDEMSVRFWFPRFESDDGMRRWSEREKIPLEFCFKAGEISNSSPPEREVRISDDEIRFQRYPAWQGEVFSNVVFFSWSSGGERTVWDEGGK